MYSSQFGRLVESPCCFGLFIGLSSDSWLSLFLVFLPFFCSVVGLLDFGSSFCSSVTSISCFYLLWYWEFALSTNIIICGSATISTSAACCGSHTARRSCLIVSLRKRSMSFSSSMNSLWFWPMNYPISAMVSCFIISTNDSSDPSKSSTRFSMSWDFSFNRLIRDFFGQKLP